MKTYDAAEFQRNSLYLAVLEGNFIQAVGRVLEPRAREINLRSSVWYLPFLSFLSFKSYSCAYPSSQCISEVSILWSYLDITLLFSSYVYLIILQSFLSSVYSFYPSNVPSGFSSSKSRAAAASMMEQESDGRETKMNQKARRWRENPKGNKEIWESREMS